MVDLNLILIMLNITHKGVNTEKQNHSFPFLRSPRILCNMQNSVQAKELQTISEDFQFLGVKIIL